LYEQLFSTALHQAEQGRLPDAVVRQGIRQLLTQRRREREQGTCTDHQERLQAFLDEARSSPVAVVPDKANEQHYEVPAEFFKLALGPQRKYSCCFYESPESRLAQAESKALELTCQQAGIKNGQQILELGCGWGSLSLWMAKRYPESQIVAVSNSTSQKAYIDQQIQTLELNNLKIVTADMNSFAPEGTFDRVVSLEMFEHMRNHELLMERIASWLNPGGKLYVHIFCHKDHPYLYLSAGPQDWMSEHFFSGGMMPSDELLLHYQKDLILERRWRWNGKHYQLTCEDWLKRTDAAREEILKIFETTYGPENARQWFYRWRMFFMACAELFGYRDGNEWWVSHYRFVKREAT